uniref:Uncharacterized protein n=1 Tax=Timema douglasi TaxID=61478 RepID=A0A7R8Z791_TIMDO|nr:unnamed protein product [Timema douglasi]
MPDETFEDLQIRTLQTTGVKINTKQFHLHGLTFDPHSNVIDYFKKYCKESIDQPVEDEIKSDHDIESDSSSEEDMDQILGDDDVEDEDEDEVEAELHPGKLCRLCAKENMHMIFIYSKNGIELGLKQRINIWLRTCVSKHDYLPKQVCGICIEKLQACEDFAMLCYQSERLLEKLVKKHRFRSKKCAIKGAERSSNVTGDELTKSTSTQPRSQIVTQEINEQSQETNSVLVPHIAESSIPPQINVDEDYSHVNSSLLDRVSVDTNMDSENSSDPVSDDDSKMDDNPQSLCVAELAECGSIPKCRVRDHGLGGSEDAKLGPVKKNDSRTRSLTCHLCLIFLTDVTDAFLHTLLFHCEKLDEFLCSLCDERFNGGTELTNHFFADHDCKCHICGKYLAKAYRLKKHLEVHKFRKVDPQEVYKCSSCHEVFPSQDKAAHHLQVDHADQNEDALVFDMEAVIRVLRCEYCDRCFSSSSVLNSHRATHTEDLVFRCNICTTAFATFSRLATHKISLELHKKVHEGCKEYSCTLCERSFVHKSSLITHLKIHKGIYPHACKYCDKRFRQLGECDDHQRKHTGERPFVCEVCSKAFRTRSMWFEHCRIHKDERPFPCEICGASFRRSFALKSHMTIHTKVRAFVCDICNKDFRLKQDLQKHTISAHLKKTT